MEKRVARLALAVAACAFVALFACEANEDEPNGGSAPAGGRGPGGATGSAADGDAAEGGSGAGEGGSDAVSGLNLGGQAGSPAPSGCRPDTATDLELPYCEIPTAPLLPTIHAGAVLGFCTVLGGAVKVGSSDDPDASSPDSWIEQNALTLGASDVASSLKIFARLQDPSCDGEAMFEHVYTIVDA